MDSIDFREVYDRDSETTLLVSHGIRFQDYDPDTPLVMTHNLADLFPNINLWEMHRDDEILVRQEDYFELVGKCLEQQARFFKSVRKRVIALGVSMGGIHSAMSVHEKSSPIDEAITISMPNNMETYPVENFIKDRVAAFSGLLHQSQKPVNCIYGGRDSSVDLSVVDRCHKSPAGAVTFHEIPKMTHRSIGHHKKEIAAILQALV